MNGDTGLTNLAVVVYPSGIDSGTAGTNLTMQLLGQLEELVEGFLATYTITTGYHDGGTLEVVLGSLDMTVENLDYVGLVRDILAHLGIDNLTLGVALVESFLHHARAYGGHLRTVIGIDDGGHDVTTKGRTNLIQQIVVVLAALLVVIVTNLELGTVGCKTRCE